MSDFIRKIVDHDGFFAEVNVTTVCPTCAKQHTTVAAFTKDMLLAANMSAFIEARQNMECPKCDEMLRRLSRSL